MAGISTIRAPEEESLIDAEDPEALSLAQEDDSMHIRGSADGAWRARSWRLGLCAAGVLCAVALLTRREAPTASLKSEDVHGITQLQFMPGAQPAYGAAAPAPESSNAIIKTCNSMTGGMCGKMETMYDDAKAKFKSILPSFMGGTLGGTTTVAPPLTYGAAATSLAPFSPATTIVNGHVYYAPTTSGAPVAPATTIINGKAYLAPTQPPSALGYYVAPVPAGSKSKSAVTTLEPPHVNTPAPQLDLNQTAQVTASVSTVKVDHNVSQKALNRQVATNPAGVQPCVNNQHPDGSPCTALKTYDYGPQYSGYTPAPAPAR